MKNPSQTISGDLETLHKFVVRKFQFYNISNGINF